jgi:hypothetical protein
MPEVLVLTFAGIIIVGLVGGTNLVAALVGPTPRRFGRYSEVAMDSFSSRIR